MVLYDTIGQGYGNLRKQDPRIAAHILNALGDTKKIINVGAGAGSYEPIDRQVVAVEPSAIMVQQRPKSKAKVVRAAAEALPFRDASFDAALASLTIHHWTDIQRGLDELGRTAKKLIVIFTFDPSVKTFWLMDYFAEIPEIDHHCMPPIAAVQRHFGKSVVIDVPIPHDCSDGFLCAYWRRPQAYLNANVRAAISTFAKIENPEPGLRRLQDDLESGQWHQRYGHLLNLSELDCGYRLIVIQQA